MTRIYTPISIPLPIETVFNYVTDPGNWPQWHPSSLSVSGAVGHSLEIGEQVTEEYLVAGRRGNVTWTVIERIFPRLWTIEGKIAGSSGQGQVRYVLQSQDGGTLFGREFTYSMGSLFYSVLNRVFIRRRIEAESWQAVRQLKKVLLEQQASSASTSM
ncbi:MAG TPA: SRPBCC family protein [Ktedonobacteraceae bacterium]|nr:SRPBCC family protein [Ktedonobacteraceae bacterium]